MTNLLTLADNSSQLTWRPFRPGIEIYRLYGDGQHGPTAALLRYEPGAAVPKHTHQGYEHIIVLSGSQRDHCGVYSAGSLVINPPGSGHTVVSDEGCMVLIIWEQPVAIREGEG
ncbi:MAG: cupin domain-containing protein [Leptolyngbyaceae cyanobacterium MO_188.B28]|nr:cupin domain-containing protein [Leptolyngbyaceae cyanobacterium MO_188.B28]